MNGGIIVGNTYDEDDDDLYREEDLNSETTVEESVPCGNNCI